MNQILDAEEWPSICFEGEFLPQSVSGISILINRDFTERTGDWIWRLRHCSEMWKDGDAEWCITSATEIIDHLMENSVEVIADIQERLGSHGFDGQSTLDEWLRALARIQMLAKESGVICRWIAGVSTEEAEESLRRLLAFLDKEDSPKS